MNGTAATGRRALAVFGLAALSLAGWDAEAAPPAAATLVAPTGVVGGSSLTFAWQAASGATFYYLHLNDATASPRLTFWFPAGQACPADSATCLVTLSTGFAAGPAIWWIQTWNPEGFGAWSAGMVLTINYLPGAWGQSLAAAERFQLVLGGDGVLDRETGLVWERTPMSFHFGSPAVVWSVAYDACLGFGTLPGGRRGWRLPTVEELASLVDPLVPAPPSLPVGHPFANVRTVPYWTATTSVSDPSRAYFVDLGFGSVGAGTKVTDYDSWCVRGGQGFNAP